MIYVETVQDLFEVPQGYCLAHCISADIAMGAGIATQFNKYYNMKERLKNYYYKMYDLYPGISIKVDNVFNLITKEKGYEKPTYEYLTEALENMREDIKEMGIKKLAMPKIGCGLDGLKWNIVKSLIKSTFEDMDIEILICIREEDIENKEIENEEVENDDLEEYSCDLAEFNDYLKEKENQCNCNDYKEEDFTKKELLEIIKSLL